MSHAAHPLRFSVHTRLRQHHLQKLLPPPSGGTFLDLGCGLAYLTRVLSLGHDRIIGLDYDFNSLSINRAGGLGSMVRGSAYHLPFKDSSVRTILCSELLEHLPEGLDAACLAEVSRVLEPGGRALITVPSLEGLRAKSPIRNLGHDDPNGGEYHYRIGYHFDDILAMLEKLPSLRLVERRYSMFLISELFMDLLKIVYFKKNKLQEHSNIMDVKSSWLFRIYQKVFPLMHSLFVFEDMLFASLFKGHILILCLTKE